MLKSNKHVFWEALLITVVVFLMGILIGVLFENGRTEEMNNYYAKSEISLADIQSMQKLIGIGDMDCETLSKANIEFADRIYHEAKILSKYEEAGKITDGIKIAHKRYDVLRTLLWINSIEAKKQCQDDVSVVVYLYEYETEDLTKKAKQSVWSRILSDLKEVRGEEIVLIPIASNADIITLNSMIEELEITEFPSVVINNEYVVNELTSVRDLEKYLN